MKPVKIPSVVWRFAALGKAKGVLLCWWFYALVFGGQIGGFRQVYIISESDKLIDKRLNSWADARHGVRFAVLALFLICRNATCPRNLCENILLCLLSRPCRCVLRHIWHWTSTLCGEGDSVDFARKRTIRLLQTFPVFFFLMIKCLLHDNGFIYRQKKSYWKAPLTVTKG